MAGLALFSPSRQGDKLLCVYIPIFGCAFVVVCLCGCLCVRVCAPVYNCCVCVYVCVFSCYYVCMAHLGIFLSGILASLVSAGGF